jgi:hypothetical protein
MGAPATVWLKHTANVLIASFLVLTEGGTAGSES